MFREHERNSPPSGRNDWQTKGKRFQQAGRLALGPIIRGKAKDVGVDQFLVFPFIGNKAEDGNGILQVLLPDKFANFFAAEAAK